MSTLSYEFYESVGREIYAENSQVIAENERNFVVAIIDLARRDLKSSLHKRGAIEYFESDSFDFHCTIIGLNADKIRHKLLK